jgi:hypothetical protein
LPIDIRQAELATLKFVREPQVIDPQTMKDRGL